MASLKTIRANVAATVTAALNGGYQISPYPLSAPVCPAGEVANFGVTRHASMGANGAQWWTCVVRAYVAVTTVQGAQMKADALLEADPVSAALEANPTLDGACDDLIVDRCDERFWDHPGLQTTLVGVEWQLRILI